MLSEYCLNLTAHTLWSFVVHLYVNKELAMDAKDVTVQKKKKKMLKEAGIQHGWCLPPLLEAKGPPLVEHVRIQGLARNCMQHFVLFWLSCIFFFFFFYFVQPVISTKYKVTAQCKFHTALWNCFVSVHGIQQGQGTSIESISFCNLPSMSRYHEALQCAFL